MAALNGWQDQGRRSDIATPRAVANLSIFKREMFRSPRSTLLTYVRCRPANSASRSCGNSLALANQPQSLAELNQYVGQNRTPCCINSLEILTTIDGSVHECILYVYSL